MSERNRYEDLAAAPAGMSSCEHCRTVTWAGTPACRCEFGLRAQDEGSTRALWVPPARRGTPES